MGYNVLLERSEDVFASYGGDLHPECCPVRGDVGLSLTQTVETRQVAICRRCSSTYMFGVVRVTWNISEAYHACRHRTKVAI